MRHRVKGKQLNRNSAQRRSLLMNLMTSLFEHGRIQTTLAKAQFLRGNAERIVTIAKHGIAKAEENPAAGIHARRIVASRLNNNRVIVQKLFDEIAPKYANREGGYLRIVKIGFREGDRAEMAVIEFVGEESK